MRILVLVGWMIGMSALAQEASNSDKNANVISGHCQFVDVPRGSMATVCNGIVIFLTDESGKSVAEIRTNREGNFSFSVPPGKRYRLASKSNYTIVKPIVEVSPGQKIQLKLKHK